MNDLDVAWAAGFFEGEGSCHIAVCNPTPYFRLSIDQVYREPLDKMVTIFGGKVYGPYGPYGKSKSKPIHQWVISGDTAKTAALTMLPLLMHKGDQVREVMERHYGTNGS